MKVVLVHGFFDSGKVMENIAKRLTQDGHQCLTPSLKPNVGRDGLDVMARQLHEILETEMDNTERFALVGLSMCALITRYYLQELNGH